MQKNIFIFIVTHSPRVTFNLVLHFFPSLELWTIKMAKKNADEAALAESNAEDLVEAQRRIYDILGHPARVIYDLYPTMSTLQRKLGFLFSDEEKYEKSRELAEIIWAQRFCVGSANAFGVRMAPIFVICVYDNYNMRRKFTHPLDLKSNKYSMHPVFRVQKCVHDESDARGCCAIFIDELCRVYKDWQDFTENNKFADCVMLTPKDGIYMGDQRHNEVLLDVFLRKSGVTHVMDVGSTIVGVAAAGLTLAALVPAITVAPVVVAGATISGLSCAVYTGIRSTYDLYDRSKHRQSIGIKSKEARAAYFNIVTGTLLAAASGASQVLSKLVQNGKNVPRIAQLTARGMQCGTFGLQTVGCVDGVYSIVKKLIDGEEFSVLEAAQLGTALFLWTHSARNVCLVENAMKISGTKNTMATKPFMLTTQKMGSMINSVREVDGLAIVREIQATFSVSSQQSVEMEYDRSMGVIATARIDYCRVFDARIESIVRKLDRHYKHNELSALKNCLVQFMCGVYNMTLRGIECCVDYAHELAVDYVCKMGEEFKRLDHLVQVIVDYIKQHLLSRMSPMTVNDYMIGLNNRDIRLRQFNDELRDDVFATIQAHAWTVLPKENVEPENSISEDTKVALALEDKVEDLMKRFERFDIGGREMELREVITGIVKTLTLCNTENFFRIAISLICKHAESIKTTLKQSIPVDNFINAIFCVLDMRNETDRIESVLDKLYGVSLPMEIDKEFAQIYQPVTTEAKILNCKKCSGKKCSE